MPTSENARPRAAVRFLILLAALAPVSALLACGGSNPAAGAAASDRSSEQRAEQKATEFAKCLREHGVNAQASSSGGNFSLKIQGSPASGGKVSAEAAQKACAKYQPEAKKVNVSPQEKVQREEELMKFAKCMREHGIDIHAETSEGKVAVQIHGSAGSGPNPESPAFQSAQKACSGFMKDGPRGGGVPVPGGQAPDGAESRKEDSEAGLTLGG